MYISSYRGPNWIIFSGLETFGCLLNLSSFGRNRILTLKMFKLEKHLAALYGSGIWQLILNWLNLSYRGLIHLILVVNETRHIQSYLVLKWKLNSKHRNMERILKWKQGSWKQGWNFHLLQVHNSCIENMNNCE